MPTRSLFHALLKAARLCKTRNSSYNRLKVDNKIRQQIEESQRIVILQADNPDADSLGSALALEQILGEMGKSVALYCAIDVPSSLKYLAGWDRVVRELPSTFDLAIIVDASTFSLFDNLKKAGKLSTILARPLIVLDHHSGVKEEISGSNVNTLVDIKVASTGELIYKLALKNNWPLDVTSGRAIMASILGDSQGLTNDLAQAGTYHVMADLLELGVSRVELEESRREFSRMSQKVFAYKSDLMHRVEFKNDGKLAVSTIFQAEINEFSPLYNPSVLIHFEVLQVDSVAASIFFKVYDSGRVTASIRTKYGFPIAAQLAEVMGGGGHDYSAGFRIENTNDFDGVKLSCETEAIKLIEAIEPK